MKVFISWSKQRSRQLALVLRDWLPEVIQQVEPWVSSEDIDKGQRWGIEVGARLAELSQGILCVTAENTKEPWLNFEAGALAKSLDQVRVRPILLDIKPTEVTGPLAHFQATQVTDKVDMLKLMGSLNAACTSSLDERRLRRAFEKNWDEFASRVAAIKPDPDEPKLGNRRSSEDMLGELLDLVRSIQREHARQTEVVDGDIALESWPIDQYNNKLAPGEPISFVLPNRKWTVGTLGGFRKSKDGELLVRVIDNSGGQFIVPIDKVEGPPF